ncbi:MAG: caspase domain-containing protein [Chitinophagales bacterium]
MQNQPKIYALLTAINNYAYIRGLYGCINDANNFQTYIKEASIAQNKKIIPKTLHDQEATKNNIVEAFDKHLGLATENDICLFYFSGHGGQETTHPAFDKYEPDGKLEVLACHDSRMSRQGSFLADKELRYMIGKLYQKTKAQIITIFDCCHSGTNTRDRLTIRRLMNDAPGRDWEGFIFGEKITIEEIQKATSLDDVLPQGKHIQLAACADKESAYESNGQGIFTSNLLAVLKQSKGKINYQNLISILGLKIKGKQYPQTPQLESPRDNQAIFQPFLGGITEHQKHQANLVFNSESNAWLLDRGAIHGIQKDNPDLCIEAINDAGEVLQKAIIEDIQINRTKVHLEANGTLEENIAYKAQVSGLIVNSLQVYIKGEQAGLDAWNQHLKETNQRTFSVEMVEIPETADYWVKAENNTYNIYLPFQEKLPLTKKVVSYHNSGVQYLMDYLEGIANWTFLKNLDNHHTLLRPNPPIELQIFVKQPDNQEIEIPIKNGQAVFNRTETVSKRNLENTPTLQVRMRLHNPTTQPYYCALLYLSQDFGVLPQILEGSTVELLPNREVWSFGGRYLSDTQADYIKHYNWEAESHYLKLIVSTHPFDVNSLMQEGLPTPEIVPLRIFDKRVFTIPKAPRLEDWTSQLIELKIPNPDYKKTEQAEI